MNLGWILHDTEVRQYITYRIFERNAVFDGLSATNIRINLAFGNKEYIEKYCPKSVLDRFEYLVSYYKDVVDDPKADFSME